MNWRGQRNISGRLKKTAGVETDSFFVTMLTLLFSAKK